MSEDFKDRLGPWRPLRRARHLQLGGLGAFAVGLLLVWLQPMAWIVAPFAMLLAIVGTLLLVAGGVLANRFKCPRCGHPFFVRHGRWVVVHNSFARKCMTCGLARGASQTEIRSRAD